MRILILSHDKTLFTEGSESRARMAERGKICEQLFILATAPDGAKEAFLAPNVRAVAVSAPGKLRLYWALHRAAKRIVKNEKINLVVSQDPFEFGKIARSLSRKFQIPFIVELHGDFYSTGWWKWSGMGNFFRHYAGRGILRAATHIRAVSERIRASLVLKLGIPDGKISVFPVETDVKIFLDAPPSPFLRQRYGNFELFLLTVGALAKVKNISMQLAALADIVKAHPKTALVVVGEGPERGALERLAARLRIAQNVVFAGAQKDLLPYYKSADMFLLTSHAEGWGRAAVEAMASGLAVIMTDTGLAGEFLTNGKNGLVVPVGDVKALKKAIEKLMSDEALRKRLGEAAQEAARTLPSHDGSLKQYKECWEKCAEHHEA